MLNRLLLLLLILPTLASAAERKWNWFKATSVQGGWDNATGQADIVFKGREITATLYWKDSESEVRITLRGFISGSKVTVREIIHNSDVGSSTYSGAGFVGKWPEFNGTVGVESITLSDGLSMIGISRDVAK